MENSFGDYLKKLREQRGYSINQLALKSGVSNAHISRLERGLRPAPSPDVIEKFASALNADYLEMLKAAGYIGRPGRQASMAREDLAKYGLTPAGPMVKIPVLGVIRAGMPIYAEQNIKGWREVPADEVKDGEYFYLDVVGDSMIDLMIFPGSHVLVRRQDYVDDGRIAVVLVNGESATVKRVKYLDGKVMLLAANSKYDPQIYDAADVQILGKVVKAEVWYE